MLKLRAEVAILTTYTVEIEIENTTAQAFYEWHSRDDCYELYDKLDRRVHELAKTHPKKFKIIDARKEDHFPQEVAEAEIEYFVSEED